MEVNVSFSRGFRLNLDGGKSIDFKAGPQKIDEVLLGHWYVQANRNDIANGGLLLKGSKDFLERDRQLAEKLMQEQHESNERQNTLRQLLANANDENIRRVVAGMTGADNGGLSDAQRALHAAADRQALLNKEQEDAEARRQASEAAKQEGAQATLVRAAAGDAGDSPGPDHSMPGAPSEEQVQDAAAEEELRQQQATADETETKPSGRPTLRS